MRKTAAFLVLLLLCVYTYIRTSSADQDPYLITDYSRLHPVKVERVVRGKETAQLVSLLREAKERQLKVSIAGQRHSQGGHTYYKDGIVVDMTAYNQVLDVNPLAKTVTVQAGATWADVQRAVQPYGLALKTMQSQAIFTVGGSVSVNAHGRDIRNGSMIQSVQSFTLLMADGTIRKVSRTENADLFPLALGGYGLFGVILDVTLLLTVDEMYRMHTDWTTVEQYSRYFSEQVMANPDIRMHIARISVAPDHFLTEMYALNYQLDKITPLEDFASLDDGEKWVIPAKAAFALNRLSDWGKNAFWAMQKKYAQASDGDLISRNNAMRSDSAFMAYDEPGANDLLQEYFVPTAQFANFVTEMRTVLLASDLNLLNITVRYVNQDREAALSYAQDNMFALVCLFHMPLTAKAQRNAKREIQEILDVVLRHHGTYYLPYAPFASRDQFHRAYPAYRAFWSDKEQFDPDLRFMNYFYEDYKGG